MSDEQQSESNLSYENTDGEIETIVRDLKRQLNSHSTRLFGIPLLFTLISAGIAALIIRSPNTWTHLSALLIILILSPILGFGVYLSPLVSGRTRFALKRAIDANDVRTLPALFEATNYTWFNLNRPLRSRLTDLMLRLTAENVDLVSKHRN